MATSAPNVWACGDCVETEARLTGKRGPYMLWNNARLQGRVAGSNAAGTESRYGGSLNVTTVGFEDQSGASVGLLAADLPADEVKVVHRDGHDGAMTLVLRDGRLVGGLYGVAMGRVFFGESMFSRVSDASKVAMVALVHIMRQGGYGLIDCQVETEHLNSLGAHNINRLDFERRLAQTIGVEPASGAWHLPASCGDLL